MAFLQEYTVVAKDSEVSLCFPVKSETNLSLQYLNVQMYRIFNIGFLLAIN